MPFKSPEQERFLWKFHPEIARKWYEEHGHAKGYKPPTKRKRKKKSDLVVAQRVGYCPMCLDTTTILPVRTFDNTTVYKCSWCGYEWKIERSSLNIFKRARLLRTVALDNIIIAKKKKNISEEVKKETKKQQIERQFQDILSLSGVTGIYLSKRKGEYCLIVRVKEITEQLEQKIPKEIDGLKVYLEKDFIQK